MSNHGRRGALAIAATLVCALLLPSTALAGHDLVIYKQEAHVDLVADEATSSVSCNPGDFALDGMWRIDHADQDDYVAPLTLIASAVDVIQAEPTSDSTYTFSFVKNAIGRAQAKIFVTCLGQKTSGDAHQHSFVTSFTKSDGTALGPNAFDSQTTSPVTGIANPAANVTSISTPLACPTNSRLVSPGFRGSAFPGGEPPSGIMRPVQSISSNGRDWTWKFENSALPNLATMSITTTWRCLKIKVPQTPGPDKHKLVFKFKNPVTFKPGANKVSEGQYNCGDHYKAIVAGFSIPTSGSDKSSYDQNGDGLYDTTQANTAFNHVYFLGMDPRPKQRAYRFVNRGPTTTWPITLQALCINYRTT